MWCTNYHIFQFPWHTNFHGKKWSTDPLTPQKYAPLTPPQKKLSPLVLKIFNPIPT